MSRGALKRMRGGMCARHVITMKLPVADLGTRNRKLANNVATR